MTGLGTLINTAAIVAGGLIGMISGRWLKDNYREILSKANAVAVLFVGISGTIANMIHIEGDSVSMEGSMMMIISLALGSLIGEFLDIDGRFIRFGEWLKQKTGNAKDAQFVSAFVTASLTVCIGAMAIVGSIQDGLSGNYETLAMKAVLDFAIIMVMAASLGKGAIFSAIPVFILQGSVTLLAKLVAPLLSAAAISNLSLVGSVLIFCVGANLLKDRTFRVANMLPAIVIAVIWTYIF
ncbi:MAG: DUF554 domain-containing protein [Erysipelotrichaceae bacterium]|nr:DUF554 domain-containing protein [Erysipelotrichaceae bacterium]